MKKTIWLLPIILFLFLFLYSVPVGANDITHNPIPFGVTTAPDGITQYNIPVINDVDRYYWDQGIMPTWWGGQTLRPSSNEFTSAMKLDKASPSKLDTKYISSAYTNTYNVARTKFREALYGDISAADYWETVDNAQYELNLVLYNGDEAKARDFLWMSKR